MHIERRSNVDYLEFTEKFALPANPVILTDATAGWKTALNWTPDTFKERFGTRVFLIGGNEITLADYIDQLSSSTRSNPAPYFHNIEFSEHFPELLPEIPYFKYAEPDRVACKLLPRKFVGTGWYELFIGGTGGEFPVLHTDFKGAQTWINQIFGEKECIMFSPDQKKYMYPTEKNRRHSTVNPFSPDIEVHPLFNEARPIKCTLHPGESLYVPPNWWHCTRMVSTSITVISAHLTSTNWKDYIEDEWFKRKGRMSRLPVRCYLGILGVILDSLERRSKREF